MLETELYIKNMLDQMTVLTFKKLELTCTIASAEKNASKRTLKTTVQVLITLEN